MKRTGEGVRGKQTVKAGIRDEGKLYSSVEEGREEVREGGRQTV